MGIERNITESDRWFTGTDKILTFEILDSDPTANPNAAPIDLTTWTLNWMVKRNPKTVDASALLTKAAGSGLSLVGIFNSVRATNTQRVRVVVSDTDLQTAALKAVVEYRHELKRMDAGSEEVLVFGTMVLMQAVHID